MSGEAQAERLRAQLLFTLKRPADAMVAWRSAEAAWGRINDGPGQVQAIAWQSVLEGDVAASAALLKRAMTLAEAETVRPRAAALQLRTITPVLANTNRLADARRVFEVVVNVQRRVAADSEELTESLANLGVVAFFQSDYVSAREYGEQALAHQLKIDPQSEDVLRSLNILGSVTKEQADYTAARDYFGRCLELAAQLAPNSQREADCAGNIGQVAREQGDLIAARRYYERSQAINQARKDPVEESNSFDDMGSLYYDLGNLAEARTNYLRGLALREQQGDAFPIAISFHNLGLVASAQGDIESARDYFERALAMHRKLERPSLDMANTLVSIGSLLRQQRDLPGAKDYFSRALAMAEEVSPGTQLSASSLGSLGVIALQQRDFASAERYFNQSLALSEKLAPGSVRSAVDLSQLGMTAFEQGDYVRAEALHRRALALRESVAPNMPGMVDTVHLLAKVLDRVGRSDEALGLSQRAWALVRLQSVGIVGDEARQAFESRHQEINQQLVRLLIAAGRVDEAFATSEDGRARALLDLMGQRSTVRRLAPADRWQQYDVAQAATNRAGRSLEAAGEAEAAARLALERDDAIETTPIEIRRQRVVDRQQATRAAQQAYARARVESDRLWAEIRASIENVMPAPVSTAEARSMLPAGTVLLSFNLDEAGGTLFVVTRDAPVRAFPLAIGVADLAARLEALRRPTAATREVRGVSPVRSEEPGVAAGRVLYQTLFPLEARRAIDKARRILIAPDGVLWDLPFAALIINEKGTPRYLGLEKPLSYAQSLTTFAQTARMAPGDGIASSVLVVGNPMLDPSDVTSAAAPGGAPPGAQRRATGELALVSGDGTVPPPLPFAEAEARAVARIYGGRAATGSEPTEAWFRERASQADVIHLATHGYFNSFRAIGSGLRFAVPREPSTDTVNDGALQAWEVFTEIPLRASLVVLSACETGAGSKVAGEGLVGLTRAFQVAGAASIVATQWSVADQSTATAMVAFHRGLQRGLARDEALRQAMRAVARDKSTAHPYYWAPFVLVGDVNAMNVRR
ncbi:MAG TPA: CHAT domain-containing protein [Vicinamibacterales bacterium]|nr:CHAT domain-containing protein [Vicinamibacterales bacterium]